MDSQANFRCQLRQTLKGDDQAEVFCVKVSKSGEYLMSGHADRVARLWNVGKGTFVSSFEGAHNREIFDIAIAEDNEKFFTCGGDRLVYMWEVVKGQWVRKFDAHTERVNSVSLNPSLQNVLASGSYDATVLLWDLLSRNNRPIQSLGDFGDSVTKVAMTSTQIIASSVDGFLRVFDIRMMKLLRFGQFDSINSFDVGLDLSFLALSTLDSSIHLLDISDGQLVQTYKGGHTSTQYHGSVKYTLDGNKYLVTGSEDGAVVLYDTSSKAVACRTESGQSHSMPVISIDVIKGNRIVSGSADSTIKVWDFSTIQAAPAFNQTI